MHPLYWRIPPGERVLSDEGIDVYVECKLPLVEHADLWTWLHNLTTPDDVRERLAHEVLDFLADL